MDGLINGRIAHYVMGENDYTDLSCYKGTGAAHHRPAIVTENLGNDRGTSESPAVNLTIFPDAVNDGYSHRDGMPSLISKTSVCYSRGCEAGTWHFPQDCAPPKPTVPLAIPAADLQAGPAVIPPPPTAEPSSVAAQEPSADVA